MQIGVFILLLSGLLVKGVKTAIVAVETDFTVDCGTDVGGPISVTYTDSDPTNNGVVKISSPQNRDTCSATGTAGVFTITDVRTNCDITHPDTTKAEYFLQIRVQDHDEVYQDSNPLFTFKCAYSVGEVPVATVVIADAGQLPGAPTSVTIDAQGNPDMTYTLEFVDQTPTQTPLTEATFGQTVVLKASMSGTDLDEQGIQVKSCVMKSGSASLSIIEDFCTVADMASLFQLPGFASDGESASFPIKLFALERSDTSSVQFECTVTVCSAPCNGQNCVTTTRRKRREAGDEDPEEKSVTMATKIEILPIAVPSSGSKGQTGQDESSAATCMQSLGFIVTVTVLAVLLLVAMATVVFMFNTRRREFQKQGA